MTNNKQTIRKYIEGSVDTNLFQTTDSTLKLKQFMFPKRIEIEEIRKVRIVKLS